MRKLIASLVALIGCGAAQADIVYNWQTLDSNGATSTILGQIRLTDQAVGGGSVDFQPTRCTYMPWTCAPGEERGDPASPIVSFMFRLDDGFPWVYENIHEGLGFQDAQRVSVSVLASGGLLRSGHIASGGSNAGIEMSGSDGLWTISFLSSELSAPDFRACWLDACPGITGQWVLDSAYVPAPSTLPLVLLGLAGAGAVLSRKVRRVRATRCAQVLKPITSPKRR